MNETSWLIEAYFPSRIEKLKPLIKTAIASCSMPATSPQMAVPSNVFPGATLALTSSTYEEIRGFVTVNGHEITKAEIQVRLPNWNKGMPHRLVSSKPIALYQVVSCRNYLREAESLLETLNSSMNSFEYTETVEELNSCLAKAKLLISERTSTKGNQSFFQDVPADMTPSFFIHSGHLVLSLLFSSAQKTRKKSSDDVSTATQKILIETVIPSIATTLTILNHACELSSEIKSKLNLFPLH